MNKKFLSAILFGALMVTSTGTFVSCKDYDDDIKGLQTQIDANKNAIAELQKLVGSGNWVTNVAASGSDLVVTMSNGSTVTVAGVKGADGVDGKNATEWTIGEDGYWYMDGEKTDKLAVAQNGKDGKDGVTAPSPSIENGMWVVYNWDAAKGEFVKEVTDVPAAGTSSFVVLKNGAYILNIADENGEFVEIALPATAESFTVNGITNKNVNVVYTYGEWEVPTKKMNKEMFDKLVAEFPELEDYEDGDFIAQGGKLPFIVSPANVELTKEHTFALVDMKGKDAGATLTNPTAGMPEGVGMNLAGTEIESRAAEGAAVWSVDFVPALNKKGTGYVESTELYSLVIGGPKGTISATPYVYSYTVEPADKPLAIAYTSVQKIYNEEGMDIFAKATDADGALVLNPTVMKGKYILEATDPAQVEEYGISIEGSVVTVANMPKGKDVSGIELKLTAISVNGSTAADDFTLTVKNEIAATGALADLNEVLTGTYKNGKFSTTKQTIWWSLEDLKLSALQMSKFAAASRKLVIADEDDKPVLTDATVKLYNAEKKDAKDYTEAAYIAVEIDAATILPGEYTVVLTAAEGTADDATTILKAESELTLSNPEEDLLTIKEAYLDEEGVVIAATNGVELTTGAGDYVYQFAFDKIFTLEANTTIHKYDDLDRQYDDDLVNWWTSGAGKKVIGNGNMMASWSNTTGELTKAGEVDKVHTFKVTYNLFGNTKNQKEVEFKVKWVSSIYAEDPTDVITMDAAKLKLKFDDVTSTATVDETQVDLKAITKAIYAQGASKGVNYVLFGTGNGTNTRYYVTADYALTADAYVMSSTNGYITLRSTDMALLGYNETQVGAAEAGTEVFHMSPNDYSKIWNNVVSNLDTKIIGGVTYYFPLKAESALSGDALTWYQMFKYYYTSIKYNGKYKDVTTNTSVAVSRANEIHSVVYRYVNEEDAAYFSTGLPQPTKIEDEVEVRDDNYYDCVNGITKLQAKASAKIDKTSLVEGKKVVPMQLIITDVWGKVMTYEFEVEISL